MRLKWSYIQIKEFLRVFSNYPMLWNSKHEDYPKSKLREEIYEELYKELQGRNLIHEGCEMSRLKAKIKSLKDVLRQELIKIETSRVSGADELYTPKLAWFNEASFLTDMMDITGSKIIMESPSSDKNLVNFPHNNLNSVNRDSGHYSGLTPGRKRKKLEQSTNQEVLFKSLNTMNRTRDSCQIFGEFVADQLRQLPPENAKKLRLKIQRDILEACEDDCTPTRVSPVLYCTLVEDSVQESKPHTPYHET